MARVGDSHRVGTRRARRRQPDRGILHRDAGGGGNSQLPRRFPVNIGGGLAALHVVVPGDHGRETTGETRRPQATLDLVARRGGSDRAGDASGLQFRE